MIKIKNSLKRAISGLLVTTGLISFGPPSFIKIQDYLNRECIEKRLNCLEEKLSDNYDIDIGVWKEPGQESFGRPVPKEQTSLRSFSPYVSLKALEGLEKTLECYPEDIIGKYFEKIDLVKSFIPSYNPRADNVNKPTNVARVTWWGKISISAGRDSKLIYHKALLNNIFEEENLHHEIGHELTRDIPEEDWEALNPNANYYPNSWKSSPEIPPGFYNKYATSSIKEDIPSTVELLYSDRNNYTRRVSRDPILKSKAEFLKAWYYRVSNGRFDQEYWDAIQSGDAPVFKDKK